VAGATTATRPITFTSFFGANSAASKFVLHARLSALGFDRKQTSHLLKGQTFAKSDGTVAAQVHAVGRKIDVRDHGTVRSNLRRI